MKKQHKTARGKIIDMDAIIKQNQETIAVSNSRTNARGDILDKNNKVLVPIDKIARKQHEINTPPENMEMSKTESITKTAKSRKKRKEVNRTEKTDISGKKVTEIEYDDGSIKVIKEEKNEKDNTN